MNDFPIEDDTNGAELIDKNRPDGDVGKRHTCVALYAAYKVWTCTERFSVVPHWASKICVTVLEVKTRGGEGTSELDRVWWYCDKAVWGVRSNSPESKKEQVWGPRDT